MKLISISALALVVAAQTVSAATVSSDDEITITGRTTNAPYTGTFTFDEFDPSLGTLLSATLTFSYGFFSIVQLVGTGGLATAESQMHVTFTGGTGTVLGSSISDMLSESSSVTLASGETTSQMHFDLTMSSPYELADFAAITGSDTFGIDYSIITDALITGADGSFATSGKLEARITYTYEALAAVPTTPALPLLACALPLLLLWRRRRA